MNEWLAQYFGTAPVAEESEKQASAELFVKLAMENGIDLNAMSDAEVQELYESTMGKMAEDDKGKEEDEKKKKVEEAAKEHEEKKESQAKFAEAVFMGQTMAHAFTAELDAIEQQKEAASAKGVGEAFREGGASLRSGVKRMGELLSGSRKRQFDKAMKHHIETAQKAKSWGGRMESEKAKELAGKLQRRHTEAAGEFARAKQTEANKVLAARLGAGGLAAGGAAAGTAAAMSGRDKKSSALDELAAEEAVEKVASAGWNVDEAVDRISAILTLGVDDENSKVAYAQDLSDAIEVRALELAEAAGYPVNWPTE